VRIDSATVTTSADGVFRIRDLLLVRIRSLLKAGAVVEVRSDVTLAAGDVFIAELTIASPELRQCRSRACRANRS